MADSAESPPSSSRKQQSSRRAQKLSEERLARKRELDRQAQRSARVKTKNHIAHLESRIETLTKVQGTGDVKSLIDQIENLRKENEALKGTLKTISKLVGNTSENGVEIKSPEDEKVLPLRICNGAPETEDIYEHAEPRSCELHMSGPSNSNSMVLSNNGMGMVMGQPDLLPHTYSQAPFSQCGPSGPPFFGTQMGHGKMGGITLSMPSAESLVHAASLFSNSEWRSTSAHCCDQSILLYNELLAQCSKLQLKDTANQKVRDADIAIRAVLHGWNAVTERYALDPVWQTLRHADNAMFSKCFSPIERLVCLRGVSLKLRHQVNPTEQNLEELPTFLHDRPSQRYIQHPPLIDYLVWPGLRERLVFDPHRYCSEKFPVLFWPCFRFTWEYEFRDAYICNPQTGIYQFSAPYLECSRDLNYYRMVPKLFTEFPEMRADIPMVAPQIEPNGINFDGGANGFIMGTAQGMGQIQNGIFEGEGFN